MGFLIIAVLLAYAGTYGAKEIATEGAKNWGTLAKRVRKEGTWWQKAGVSAVSGAAWVGRTAGRGVRNAVREDRKLIRQSMTPEARAHRENRGRAKRQMKEQAKIQRAGRRELRRERRRADFHRKQQGRHVDTGHVEPDPAAVEDWRSRNGGAEADRQRMEEHERALDDQFYRTPEPPAAPAPGTPPASAEESSACPGCGDRWWWDCELCRRTDGNEPPVAPASGPAPTIGEPMPQATGEANTYSDMQSQLALLAGDGDKLCADANVIAQAAERLDAAAVQFKLDPASRAALNRIGAACAEIAQAATQIRPQAQAASTVVQQQQGNLHEAHQAQPNAASEEFVKA